MEGGRGGWGGGNLSQLVGGAKPRGRGQQHDSIAQGQEGGEELQSPPKGAGPAPSHAHHAHRNPRHHGPPTGHFLHGKCGRGLCDKPRPQLGHAPIFITIAAHWSNPSIRTRPFILLRSSGRPRPPPSSHAPCALTPPSHWSQPRGSAPSTNRAFRPLPRLLRAGPIIFAPPLSFKPRPQSPSCPAHTLTLLVACSWLHPFSPITPPRTLPRPLWAHPALPLVRSSWFRLPPSNRAPPHHPAPPIHSASPIGSPPALPTPRPQLHPSDWSPSSSRPRPPSRLRPPAPHALPTAEAPPSASPWLRPPAPWLRPSAPEPGPPPAAAPTYGVGGRGSECGGGGVTP